MLNNKWFFEVNLPYSQSDFIVNPGPMQGSLKLTLAPLWVLWGHRFSLTRTPTNTVQVFQQIVSLP